VQRKQAGSKVEPKRNVPHHPAGCGRHPTEIVDSQRPASSTSARAAS
jgi:hypothetical protein